jgi:hypothetical protein
MVVAGVILVVGIYVFAAAALVITRAAIEVLRVVSLEIRGKEQAFSLTSDITDPVARAARRINRVYTRGHGLSREISHHRHNT